MVTDRGRTNYRKRRYPSVIRTNPIQDTLGGKPELLRLEVAAAFPTRMCVHVTELLNDSTRMEGVQGDWKSAVL